MELLKLSKLLKI